MKPIENRTAELAKIPIPFFCIFGRNTIGTMEQLVNYFREHAPSQYKRYNLVKQELGPQYEKDVERFVEIHLPYWQSKGWDFNTVLQSYLKLCEQYLFYQIRFAKWGVYPWEKDPDATLAKIEDLYKNPVEMQVYMAGLSLSLVLWKSHYLTNHFFRNILQNYRNRIGNYLEVGTGHGIHFKTAVELLDPATEKSGIDISPVSVQMTREVVNFFHPEEKHNLQLADFLESTIADDSQDLIVMGEVVEHVIRPGLFLQKARKILRPGGRLFISTCVNCPMIDHLYRFGSTAEIANLLKEEGFEVESELLVPSENLPMEEIIRQKITINYAALVKKTEI
jgi:ubiquinone/menaquinone biosynthesis C-methylase UbiE